MSCDYRRFVVTWHPRATNELGYNSKNQINSTRNFHGGKADKSLYFLFSIASHGLRCI